MGTPREYFKGVVWPRGAPLREEGKPPNYRYVVVGMIVSDQPIPELEAIDHKTVLDGPVHGVLDLLSFVRQREAKLNLGDAVSVLLELEDL